ISLQLNAFKDGFHYVVAAYRAVVKREKNNYFICGSEGIRKFFVSVFVDVFVEGCVKYLAAADTSVPYAHNAYADARRFMSAAVVLGVEFDVFGNLQKLFLVGNEDLSVVNGE
ncbi:MAG: hypothetical protein MJ193_04890, partial [Clostridia bacterium]|nr:hypothetical protein [Clostridia bacterium]